MVTRGDIPILFAVLVLWTISFILSTFAAIKNGWNVKKWFLSGLFLEIFGHFCTQLTDSMAKTKTNSQKRSVMMANNKEVVVVDVNMPFMSIVTFMVKVAIAAIPASIILFFVYFFIFQVLLDLMKSH